MVIVSILEASMYYLNYIYPDGESYARNVQVQRPPTSTSFHQRPPPEAILPRAGGTTASGLHRNLPAAGWMPVAAPVRPSPRIGPSWKPVGVAGNQ